MNNAIVFITLILAVMYNILNIWVLNKEGIRLTEKGRKLRIWGSLTLTAVFLLSFITIVSNSLENLEKWYYLMVILIATGFNTFVEWKYRKGSKMYTIDVILLIVGVSLVYLFYF